MALMTCAFSAEVFLVHIPGALPQVRHGESVLWRTVLSGAPLALKTYAQAIKCKDAALRPVPGSAAD